MQHDYDIPFNKVIFGAREHACLAEAVSRTHISGDGHFTARCSALLEAELGVPRVLLTTSCTHALEMAALLLEIAPGDEVIVPSFTFVSTVNAFVLRGARPVFADIRPDTLNLDESLLERLVTPRTKAIVPVHYAGVGCAMEAITALATSRGIAVVEDNAHGLFGRYKGRYLGTFGAFAAQSFHETKNFTCGEGGALVINDARFVDRAEILREKGTNRRQFFAGQVDKYTWVDIGSSYLPADILAALLYPQLEERERIQRRRAQIWDYYADQLRGWAAATGARLPFVPAECEHPAHMFYLLMPSAEKRRALIEHLRSKSILAIFHYLPLHLSRMGRQFGGRDGDCPVTEDVSERLVRLPFFNCMTDDELCRVVAAVRECK